ncbi:MAG: hypothetical protein KAR20_12905 [Candidatus Heimdallarchaeota archaeon]|nr:hypothetical protein [Candidatus Heimdallarchaeota archaeon]
MLKKSSCFLTILLVLFSLGFSQGEWKDGGLFGFDKPSEDLAFVTDSRGVIHAVARNGTELRHYMRGSKNPFPWETEGRVIPGSYYGSGHIQIWKDGNLIIIWPRSDGQNQTYWENPKKFKDPSKIPPGPIIDPSPPYIGASYYSLQIEKTVDIKWFLEQVRINGGNATEIFLNFTWPLAKSDPWKSYSTSGWKFTPYKIVGEWSESKFGDYKFPMFDLDRWDPKTWRRLKTIFEECRKNGIALFIRIQDYCSIKDPFYKRHYPYNKGSNIQQYSGGTYEDGIRPHYKKFNRKLMDTLQAADLKHYFIIAMNEADVLGDDPDEWKDETLIDFHQFYWDDLSSLGLKKEQFIINIDREIPRKHFRDLAYRIELHGINSPKRLRETYAESGTFIFPNGDGPDPYALGIPAANGMREASFEQGVEMGGIIREIDGWHCYLLRSPEAGSNPNNWSVRLSNFIALRGLAAGIR